MFKIIVVIVSSLLMMACGSDDAGVYNEEKTVTLIEAEQYEIKPITATKQLETLQWHQTCGNPVLTDIEKSSLSFMFTAPESVKDETYCFEFNGESVNGDVYINKLVVNVVAPTLEVYIDHASLPTLQQLMHIISKYNTTPTHTRFVSWDRVKLNSEEKSKLNITTYGLTGTNTSNELVNAVYNFVQGKNRVKLELYSNTMHSLPNLYPILSVLNNSENVVVNKVNLYDDGSAEYVGLYNWRNVPDKIEVIESDVEVLKQYLSGESKKSPSGMSARYNWHVLYPTEYHFLRKDYINLEPKLNELGEYIGSSLKQMQWNGFNSLSKDKQDLFLNIVGFDRNWLQSQYDKSILKNFVFTGTTTWAGNETREFYAKQQVNVINNAINETSPIYLGEDVDLFFKGHPRGGDINDMIMGSFSDITEIPSKISFEVLMMTDMLPDFVAGIASSLYFTIPSENVRFIVFTSSETITDREEALKSPLVQVMMKLGIVKESSVLFWADLPNCETGICIEK